MQKWKEQPHWRIRRESSKPIMRLAVIFLGPVVQADIVFQVVAWLVFVLDAALTHPSPTPFAASICLSRSNWLRQKTQLWKRRSLNKSRLWLSTRDQNRIWSCTCATNTNQWLNRFKLFMCPFFSRRLKLTCTFKDVCVCFFSCFRSCTQDFTISVRSKLCVLRGQSLPLNYKVQNELNSTNQPVWAISSKSIPYKAHFKVEDKWRWKLTQWE